MFRPVVFTRRTPDFLMWESDHSGKTFYPVISETNVVVNLKTLGDSTTFERLVRARISLISLDYIKRSKNKDLNLVQKLEHHLNLLKYW